MVDFVHPCLSFLRHSGSRCLSLLALVVHPFDSGCLRLLPVLCIIGRTYLLQIRLALGCSSGRAVCPRFSAGASLRLRVGRVAVSFAKPSWISSLSSSCSPATVIHNCSHGFRNGRLRAPIVFFQNLLGFVDAVISFVVRSSSH